MSSIFNAVGGEARVRVRWGCARAEKNGGLAKLLWKIWDGISYFSLPPEGDAKNHVHK